MIARIGSAVVLGAGTMGAQLGCLLAGAGVRVRLLDLEAEVARRGLERALTLRPSPVYRADDGRRIATGGFDELEEAVADTDWVIEAVVERLEPKQALFARLDEILAGRATTPIVSSNTSGLSIRALADGRSERFRSAFLGTHFFNPPRYARLVEVIPLAETDPAHVARLREFLARHLGKGTVIARDTPAFIANRLGVHGMLLALDLAGRHGLGVDEVDELTGPLIGRPKSATFRTIDLVGVDVAVAVAEHCRADLPDDPERERFTVPRILRRLLEDGALGEKAGRGFYRRRDGEVLALDLETGEYRVRRRVSSPTLELARVEPHLPRRLATLLDGRDPAARFLEELTTGSLAYAATVAPEIAEDAVSVDRAMRWGFGWELGPLETWDALGPRRVADRLQAADRPVPDLVRRVLDGPGTFHGDGTSLVFTSVRMSTIVPEPGTVDLPRARASAAGAGLPSNAAASAVELPDRILGLELHGKLNIIGLDTLDMVRRAIDLAAARHDGLVIGTNAPNFSAGANLALILMSAEEGEWDEVAMGIRRFQDASRAIRYAPIPVVLAPRGLTLGGGAEFCLAAARRQALAETYIGLVESGVGLIPAGGGSTAMARQVAERAAGASVDRFAFFQAAIETLALARVSTSAAEARELGLLGPADLVTADPDRQWADTARLAATLAETGWQPPVERPIAVVGERGLAAAEALTHNQRAGGLLSDHDRKVVLELARVLSGGRIAEGTEVAETHLLDLEREGFLRLLGEPRTRERIRHTLKTGKPLRN